MNNIFHLLKNYRVSALGVSVILMAVVCIIVELKRQAVIEDLESRQKLHEWEFHMQALESEAKKFITMHQALVEKIESLHKMTKAHPAQEAVMRGLASAARNSGVSLERERYSTERNLPSTEGGVNVDMTFTGSYYSIIDFLEKISSENLFSVIEHLEISESQITGTLVASCRLRVIGAPDA